MAVSRKVEREILREEFLQKVIDTFLSQNEDVLRVKSNEIAIPVVGCEGNEDFIVITVKVPTGANKGLEPYDGYEMAQDYEMRLSEKEEKAKQKAKEKERKIAKDKEIREKKKAIAEKGAEQRPFLFHMKRTYVRLRPGAKYKEKHKKVLTSSSSSVIIQTDKRKRGTDR